MTDDVKSKAHNKPKSNGKPTAKPAAKSSASFVKLKKRVEALEVEKKELNDRFLRKVAEFDNYKKRTESEYSQLIKNASADLITDLLPVLDDLERSLASSEDRDKADNSEHVHEGVELIYKNLSKVLEKRGVKPIESVGQKFDPEKHNALMQMESDQPSDTIIDEHLKGYEMHDRVLRHSQVLVSK